MAPLNITETDVATVVIADNKYAAADDNGSDPIIEDQREKKRVDSDIGKLHFNGKFSGSNDLLDATTYVFLFRFTARLERQKG